MFWIAYKSAGVRLWLRWQQLMSLVTARAQFLLHLTHLRLSFRAQNRPAARGGADAHHAVPYLCQHTHTCSNLTLTHLHTRPMSLRCEASVCESVSSVWHNRRVCVCVSVFGSTVSLPPWFCPRWHVLMIARVSTRFSTASTSLNVCHVGIYHIFTLSLTVSFKASLLLLFKKIFQQPLCL